MKLNKVQDLIVIEDVCRIELRKSLGFVLNYKDRKMNYQQEYRLKSKERNKLKPCKDITGQNCSTKVYFSNNCSQLQKNKKNKKY